MKEKFKEVVMRRLRKSMVIKDYWNQVTEKCSKLAKNKSINYV